jgi:AraC-like DNA-binding protein/CheY-like chemotaxis protein
MQLSEADMNEPNSRHALVTAAHDFLLAVLPFRSQESELALTRFVARAADHGCRTSEVGPVLLDVLAVLNIHARSPQLLDRYLATCRRGADPVDQFAVQVRNLIRNRTVGDLNIERAMTIVETRYNDANLTAGGVALLLGLNQSYFATRFRQRAGMKFSDYLRLARLDAAARLLASTERRVKDIWVTVGYNDASNFDHQFRDRFGVPPTEYRRGTRAESSRVSAAHTTDPDTPPRIARWCDVLIVDDHENTRETVGRYLRGLGYGVATTATGTDGIEKARQLQPRTVVLDYHLPDMDGIECLRALRSSDVPVLADVLLFTADLDAAERLREIDALRARYVSKLCDIDELVALIAASSSAHL